MCINFFCQKLLTQKLFNFYQKSKNEILNWQNNFRHNVIANYRYLDLFDFQNQQTNNTVCSSDAGSSEQTFVCYSALEHTSLKCIIIHTLMFCVPQAAQTQTSDELFISPSFRADLRGCRRALQA